MENYKLQPAAFTSSADHIHELITHFSPVYQQLPLHLPETSGYSEHFPIHQENIALAHSQTKRKALHMMSSSANSSPPVSDNGNSVEKGKKLKRSEKKEAEVVHVRAKRGQATDSHSLAERVRREKINERLRCLQDIVPGCYKTMGMAVMLDEIINYVQSLQNQVEFLSMKLTAASTFHDFNSEVADETMQRAKAFEASNIQNGVNFTSLGSFNFENSTQFPHNR